MRHCLCFALWLIVGFLAPLPAFAGTFEDFLARCLSHNPRLQAERQSVAILAQQVAVARSGFFPQAGVDASLGRQRLEVDGQNGINGQERTASLQVTQPLFDGFGTVAQQKAARLRLKAGQARLLGQEQQVLLDATTAWLALAEAGENRKLAEQNARRMQHYLDATKKRYTGGIGTRTDITQVSTRLAEAQSQLATAQGQQALAQHELQRLAASDSAVLSAEFPPVAAPLPASEEEAVQLAAASPLQQEAEGQQQASEADIDSATAGFYPRLALRGSVNDERSTAYGLRDLRNDRLTLTLSMPLYQGGAEYARLKAARLTSQQQKFLAQDVRLQAERQARNAYASYLAALSVIRSAYRAAYTASQAYNGVRKEQEYGTRSATDVLDAQTDLLRTQQAYIRAHRDMREQAYRLLAASGQLTADKLRLPTSP